MGSPLGPILANIFVASIELKLRSNINELAVYKRYVDDIFIVANNVDQICQLQERLNACHPNSKVTCEMENVNTLPFLDILISRREDGSICRSIYRKRTWTGQYASFFSFTPLRHKRALVSTLFSRVRRICTPDTLDREIEFLYSTLQSNGYPQSFISKF